MSSTVDVMKLTWLNGTSEFVTSLGYRLRSLVHGRFLGVGGHLFLHLLPNTFTTDMVVMLAICVIYRHWLECRVVGCRRVDCDRIKNLRRVSHVDGGVDENCLKWMDLVVVVGLIV